MKDYIHITPDVKFLSFGVPDHGESILRVARRGGGQSIDVEPFEVMNGKARFVLDDPAFGLCEGWYELTIVTDGCPCKIHVAKVYEPCEGDYVGAEHLAYDPDKFCE